MSFDSALRSTLRRRAPLLPAAFLCLLLSSAKVQAQGTGPSPAPALPEVHVQSSGESESSFSESASQGSISGERLQERPRARTAEVLEAVPGVVVTQHSGDGKANQYFARGFNLDHGTDFRTTVMGMPVNMPTHAHGQGYSDLNFLIPELISTVDYKKGSWYAEEGDFSAVGAANIDYVRSLPKGLVSVEAGQYRYLRGLLAKSFEVGAGNLLLALEYQGHDGPWEVPQGYRKRNLVLGYSQRQGADEWRIAAMHMQSSWTATDQVPQRALSSGLIGRYGSLDPSDGGSTERSSVSGEFIRRYSDGQAKFQAWLIHHRFDLYSNFTLFERDPLNGDQFQQSERRNTGGGSAERSWSHTLLGRPAETAVGLQLREDRLNPVLLRYTLARQPLALQREDSVRLSSAGIWASHTLRWTPWFRSILGLRHDRSRFKVDSSLTTESGVVTAGITSPKLSLVFNPARQVEAYLNWGQGFHSNDARGVTASSGAATPLVRATGREMGLRIQDWLPGLTSSLAVWDLKLASELVFVGDAGTTEASRPSQRRGVEWSNVWQASPVLRVDLDLAWSRARFADPDPAGPYIPGAVARVASLGATWKQGAWTTGVRVRHVGSRPLIEDGSVRSPSSTLTHLKLVRTVTPTTRLSLEVLNLFNRRVSDIDYYYASRLPGEPASVSDVHTHPAEPRALRIGLMQQF